MSSDNETAREIMDTDSLALMQRVTSSFYGLRLLLIPIVIGVDPAAQQRSGLFSSHR